MEGFGFLVWGDELIPELDQVVVISTLGGFFNRIEVLLLHY